MSPNINAGFQFGPVRRMTVFVGAYGSGKSEISVHFALWLATGGPAVIADLDTINPFYRSADAAARLEAGGVRLVKPLYANTNVDVPSFGGEVFSLFDDRRSRAVIDVGGEDLGARVVASLLPRFNLRETAMYMVANLHRPFTADAAGIVAAANRLVAAAGLPLAGLIDNTNLLGQEDPSALTASLLQTRHAAQRLGVPLLFRAALDRVAPVAWGNTMPDGTPLLRLERAIGYAFS